VVRPKYIVNGKGRILTPNDIKTKPLKFFRFELDIHDYVPEFYTSGNFHFRPFSEASPAISEILRFCDFFLITRLYCIFIHRHAPRSDPWMEFHGFWLVRRVFAQ